MDQEKIKKNKRVSVEDVMEAVEELGVNLLFGEYENCNNGMCPLQAIARACGFRHVEDIEDALVSKSYVIGYIRQYDGSDHFEFTPTGYAFFPLAQGLNVVEYEKGREDGQEMREKRIAEKALRERTD